MKTFISFVITISSSIFKVPGALWSIKPSERNVFTLLMSNLWTKCDISRLKAG